MKQSKMSYHVYILECSDKTLYTGTAKNLDERIQQHNNGKGAKYTRGRRPVRLLWSGKYCDQGAALREEYKIKKLTRKQKMALLVLLYKKNRLLPTTNEIKNLTRV